MENVKDSSPAQLERREHYWISTLGAQHCQGLNKGANTELSGIYHSLFDFLKMLTFYDWIEKDSGV